MHLIDLHCHTSDHSYDGQVPAIEIVKTLLEKGFSGVVFTDHNYLWSDDELGALRREAQLPEDFVLLSGQEVRTAQDGIIYGDLLVYGASQSFPDDTPPTEIFIHLRKTGGFTTAPHPSVPRIGFGAHLGSFPVVAAETWNGRYGERVANESARIAREHQLPSVGGSDTHRPEDIAGGGTLLPELPRTIADLQRLLRQGNTRAWRPGDSISPEDGSGKIKGWFNKFLK